MLVKGIGHVHITVELKAYSLPVVVFTTLSTIVPWVHRLLSSCCLVTIDATGVKRGSSKVAFSLLTQLDMLSVCYGCLHHGHC